MLFRSLESDVLSVPVVSGVEAEGWLVPFWVLVTGVLAEGRGQITKAIIATATTPVIAGAQIFMPQRRCVFWFGSWFIVSSTKLVLGS